MSLNSHELNKICTHLMLEDEHINEARKYNEGKPTGGPSIGGQALPLKILDDIADVMSDQQLADHLQEQRGLFFKSRHEDYKVGA